MKPIPMNLTRVELERWAHAENDTRVLLALVHEDSRGSPRPPAQSLLQAAARQQELGFTPSP